jgi:hypothetical protein
MRGRRGVNEDPISLFSFQDIITSVTGIIILLALLLVVELTKRPKQLVTNSVDDSASHIQAEINDLESRIEAVRALLMSSSKFANDVASIPAAELDAVEQQARKEIAALEAALAQLRQDEKRTQTATDSQSDEGEFAESMLRSIRDKNDELQSQLESVRRSNRVIYNSEDNAEKSAWLVDLKADQIEVGRPNLDDARHTFDSAGFDESFLSWAKQRNNQAEYFVLLVRPESIRLYEELSLSLTESGLSLGFDLLSSDATVMDSGAATRARP